MTTTIPTQQDVPDLATLPNSAVPAAFDRGCLYSPTLDLTRYALDPAYDYDYRPGNDFEPLPEMPRDPKGWRFWRHNHADNPCSDFLGLRAGDQMTIQHVTTHGPGTVVATNRDGAIVRYPMPKGSREPYAQMTVSRRNIRGYWYP